MQVLVSFFEQPCPVDAMARDSQHQSFAGFIKGSPARQDTKNAPAPEETGAGTLATQDFLPLFKRAYEEKDAVACTANSSPCFVLLKVQSSKPVPQPTDAGHLQEGT